MEARILVLFRPCDNAQPCPTWYEPERGAYFQRGMSLKGEF